MLATTPHTRMGADFNAKGFKITAEGEITADQIDKGMLIDQHYYAIASKATLLQPSEVRARALFALHAHHT